MALGGVMSFRYVMEPNQQEEFCLDRLGFDEWVDFVFKRPIPAEGEKEWFWDDANEKYFTIDDQRTLEHLNRLLLAPDTLLQRFSPAQVKQGLNCLVYGFDWADLLISERDIPLALRLQNVKEIQNLYEEVLCKGGLEGCAFMLWDSLAYDFFMEKGLPANDDQVTIQTAMFETLKAMLEMKERICFMSALHGLGHLRFLGTADLIRQKVAERTDLQDGDAAYAEHCIAGTMDRVGEPQFL